MKHLTFLSLLCTAIMFMAGCTQSTETNLVTFDQRDVTDDGIDEIVQVEFSDLTMAPAYLSEYPYVINKLAVYTPGEDGDRMLLSLDESGITVENGDTVPATVSTSAAYAMNYAGDDLFTFVQIDTDGFPVSEALTINWDTTGGQWKMGALTY